MERYSPKRTPAGSAQQQSRPQSQVQESFSDMANVTAMKSGVVGKLLVISLIIVSVAVTAFVGFAVFRGVNGDNLVDSGKLQAVFLSDGQIYFGKITNSSTETLTLEDVYYLQVDQQLQPEQRTAEQQQEQAKISLAKLGGELHCPVDKMFINRSQVLFWENLREEGQVAKAVNQYLEGNDGNDEVDCTQKQAAPAAETPAAEQ